MSRRKLGEYKSEKHLLQSGRCIYDLNGFIHELAMEMSSPTNPQYRCHKSRYCQDSRPSKLRVTLLLSSILDPISTDQAQSCLSTADCASGNRSPGGSRHLAAACKTSASRGQGDVRVEDIVVLLGGMHIDQRCRERFGRGRSPERTWIYLTACARSDCHSIRRQCTSRVGPDRYRSC